MISRVWRARRRGMNVNILCTAIAALCIAATAPSEGANKFVRAPAAPAAPPVNILSYVVTLNSLQLVGTNGRKVQVLPEPLKLDFAQTVDFDDAVSAGLIPVGNYTSATAVIDYSHASITAEDATGKTVTLSVLDGNDNLVTGTQTVTIKLDHQRNIVVSTQSASLLALDFNLAASTKVSLSNATATVGSTLVADVVPSGNTWVRVSGLVGAVNSTDEDFVLNVSSTAINTPARGAVTVELSPTTTYRISGTAYTGAAGEAVLGALPKGTSVSATGSLHTDHKTLAAAAIVVGS